MNEESKEFLDLWHARHVPYEGPTVYELDDTESILSVMASLRPREFEVLYLRFFLDFTLEECGHIINRSREVVRQIEAKSVRKLRSGSRLNLWSRTGLIDNIIQDRAYRKRIKEEESNKLDAEIIRLKDIVDKSKHDLYRNNHSDYKETQQKYETQVPFNIELRFCGWFPYLWIDPATGLTCARHWNPEIYDRWLNIKLKEAKSKAPGTSA